jgi:hypothetical protein
MNYGMIIGTVLLPIRPERNMFMMFLMINMSPLPLQKRIYFKKSRSSFMLNGSTHLIAINEHREIHDQITITDNDTQIEITLLQKEVEEGQTTLGVKKTIGGDESSQDKFMYNRSRTYGYRIRHAKLNRRQVKAAYSAM